MANKGKASDVFSPWHAAALDYLHAGYSVFPLPHGKKKPPPDYVTGGDQIAITEHQVRQWLSDPRPRNIGMVIPEEMIIFDVDGFEAEQRLRDYWGDVPPTWRTSSGEDGRYHLWYQSPPNRTWPGKIVAGVDVLQNHHRYLVVPPSIHPSGNLYRFINPRGKVEMYVPPIDELNIVTPKILRATKKGRFVPFSRATVDTRVWLMEHGKGKLCPEIRRVLVRHQKLLRQHAELGGMHDAMTNGVWALMAEISHGHPGGYQALKQFKETFTNQAIESGRRDEYEVDGEWGRACVGAIEKTAVERVRVGDPCIVEEKERSKDPNRFFDPKYGLKAETFQREIEQTGRLAAGIGQTIWRYADGVWTPDGEAEIYRRTEKLMRERKRPTHANIVKQFIERQVPLITDDKEDTQYLNLPNGLLDWRTKTLYPHNANIISTRRIPVHWDEEATCPEILQWMHEVFPDDAIDFAIEVLGYMLYNGNPLHKAIMLYGKGRNGKSTYVHLARLLAGHNNVSAISPQRLDSDKFAAAQLYGRLANLVGDVDPKTFKSTEVFKQLTGGDLIPAERKFGQPFEFQCTALTIASFNRLPRTADTTDGFFSRWLVLPFPRYFGDKPDVLLSTRLFTPKALSGFLSLAIDGLQRVMAQGGFSVPPSVEKSTRTFRVEADPMQAFIEERIKVNIDNLILRTELYAEYKMWCALNGYSPLSAFRFYEGFMQTAPNVFSSEVKQYRKKQGRYIQGINITR